MFGIGVLCFIYAPLLLFLKAPPTREEKKVGSNEFSLKTSSNCLPIDYSKNSPVDSEQRREFPIIFVTEYKDGGRVVTRL